MGGQCSAINNIREQYELLNEVQHSTFGTIKILKNNTNRAFRNLQIGMKELAFSSTFQQQQYINQINQAKSYENIPTLVTVFSCEKITMSNTKALTQCSSPYKIHLYFSYYSKTLEDCLIKKQNSLHSSYKIPQSVKLYDYQNIDRLGHQDRKIVSILFQEVQILRMIDHIVGGLYFLNHFSLNHEAICPKNILIDEEGKFILADSHIFQIQSNYQRALREHLRNKKSRQNGHNQFIRYLSPELLTHLKAKNVVPQHSKEKADMFNVGIIALQMCLLDMNIHDQILDADNLKLNKTELNKLLIKTRQKYSQELVNLLKNMVEYNPNQRISYSSLIDCLNPLLTSNIEKVQKIYGSTIENQNTVSMVLSGVKSRGEDIRQLKSIELVRRLSEVQNRYQNVMNNKVLLKQKPLNQQSIKQDETRILSKLKQLGGIPKQRKEKQIKGSDLYEIYLHEYESIKQHRPRR